MKHATLRLRAPAAVLLFACGLLLGCGERKVPQGPPPEYERAELPPWPAASVAPVQAASAEAVPVAVPAAGGADDGAAQTHVLSNPTPEGVDPPKGSR